MADKDKDTRMEDEGDKIEDLRDDKVVTKYKTASEIANLALQYVLSLVQAGKSIYEICVAGDKFIADKTSKIYNKGKVEKGVAFPTSLSVNNVVGHFSPAEEGNKLLKDQDVVKIDLGVHVDGYTAVVAHTVVIGVAKPTGKLANVLAAAFTASELAVRLLKPGNKNSAITDMITKVASDFKVSAVQGVLSHEMKKFVIDGEKVILNRADVDQKVDEVEFKPNEVYAIDIVFSTGDGKPQEIDERTTIYKRASDNQYNLKMKASRQVFGEILKKYPAFPFNIRELDAKTRNFGIKECRQHELVHPYPVLFEKDGEFVVQIKFTALLLPSGTVRITGVPVDLSKLASDLTLKDEGLLKLLSTSAVAKKKKKKNAKKKKKTGGAGGAGGDAEEDDGEDDDAEMQE